MKKFKMIVMFLGIFLLFGVVNVKAYNVTSLTGDVTVTINKLKLNLYEIPASNASSITLYENPITFELPLSADGFEIGSDSLTSKQIKIDKNNNIPLSLIKLETNIDEENLSTFIESQNVDKTKKYYGDIEVEYTVNTFPSSFKTFTQVNGLRLVYQKYPEFIESSFEIEVGNSSPTVKDATKTTALTSGTTFTTSQTLTFLLYNFMDEEDVEEAVDRLSIIEEVEDEDGDVSAGLAGYNYGVFSDATTFNVNSTSNGDRAIMFSILNGMDKYVDYASIATLGDDFVGDTYEDDEDEDEIGSEIVKVGNTAADQNTILVVIGLILVLSGSILVGNMIKRKRYN